jgi:hypothetical protein
VLPRVSAALAQIIKTTASPQAPASISPHAASGQRADSHNHAETETSANQESPQTPNSNVIPIREEIHNPDHSHANSIGSTFSFLRLFTTLQQHRGMLMRWFGLRAYAANASRQKQTAKYRKGVMIDQRS